MHIWLKRTREKYVHTQKIVGQLLARSVGLFECALLTPDYLDHEKRSPVDDVLSADLVGEVAQPGVDHPTPGIRYRVSHLPTETVNIVS